eukprot:GSMAST32.ASY1.ANO1.1401.1 assembled CDS
MHAVRSQCVVSHNDDKKITTKRSIIKKQKREIEKNNYPKNTHCTHETKHSSNISYSTLKIHKTKLGSGPIRIACKDNNNNNYLNTKFENQHFNLENAKNIQNLEKTKNTRNWTLSDFSIGRAIGKGKFGNVYVAKEKNSTCHVAFKVLFKSQLYQSHKKRIEILKREVEIHSRLIHKNIVRMFGYFHDPTCVYLILEFSNFGNVLDLMKKQKFGHFSEDFALQFFLDCALAIKHSHHRHVAHRDLKPENILVFHNDNNSHEKNTNLISLQNVQLKICDFGWSTILNKNLNQKSNTICGTPAYLSPEMVLGQSHDCDVDLWSLGVLLYEFSTGMTPFYDRNVPKMYENITKLKIDFSGIDKNIQKILSNLLIYKDDVRSSAAQIVENIETILSTKK